MIKELDRIFYIKEQQIKYTLRIEQNFCITTLQVVVGPFPSAFYVLFTRCKCEIIPTDSATFHPACRLTEMSEKNRMLLLTIKILLVEWKSCH